MRVQGLETQLCEMREFYNKKIQALEDAQSLEQELILRQGQKSDTIQSYLSAD